MKKLLFFLLVTFTINAQSVQESEFTLNNERGMTDFIVVPVEGKTASEIYKKVIDWIKVVYKNPDKVILSTIENEYVRFEGASETLYSFNQLGKHYEPAKYQIEISIKEGKYKFDIIGFEAFEKISTTIPGSWNSIELFTRNSSSEELAKIYKKDGSLKSANKFINEVPDFFNKLNTSLLESFKETKVKNDW